MPKYRRSRRNLKPCSMRQHCTHSVIRMRTTDHISIGVQRNAYRTGCNNASYPRRRTRSGRCESAAPRNLPREPTRAVAEGKWRDRTSLRGGTHMKYTLSKLRGQVLINNVCVKPSSQPTHPFLLERRVDVQLPVDSFTEKILFSSESTHLLFVNHSVTM